MTLQTETFDQAFTAGQELIGHEIGLQPDEGPRTDGSNGLDVLRDGPKDSLGCHEIDVPVRLIPSTPQLLGRILLYQNPQSRRLEPTVLTVNPGQSGILRVARLSRQPFVPTTGVVPGPGLTEGMRFGTGIDVQTQSATFGGHNGSQGFEGGHFSVATTAARSAERADLVRAGGDRVSDAIISNGVPADLAKFDLDGGLPIPDVKAIDISKLPPDTRLPLKWHPDLETETGAAAAYYPDAPKLLVGAAIRSLGHAGLRAAASFANDVVRRPG